MKRTLLIAVLGCAASLLTGCSYSAIKAEAPGGITGQSGPVQWSGQYTLYHVTKFDVWGSPVTTEQVATVELKSNERVGFDYVLPKEKQYMPDAQSDLIAYAGTKFRVNLGTIQSMDDHYYWCSPGEWSGVWALQAPRVLTDKALQN